MTANANETIFPGQHSTAFLMLIIQRRYGRIEFTMNFALLFVMLPISIAHADPLKDSCLQETIGAVVEKNFELMKKRGWETNLENDSCGGYAASRAEFAMKMRSNSRQKYWPPGTVEGGLEVEQNIQSVYDGGDGVSSNCMYPFKDTTSRLVSPIGIFRGLNSGIERDDMLDDVNMALLRHLGNRSPQERLNLFKDGATLYTVPARNGQEDYTVTNRDCPGETLALAALYRSARKCIEKLPTYGSNFGRTPSSNFRCADFKAEVFKEGRLNTEGKNEVLADESCTWSDVKNVNSYEENEEAELSFNFSTIPSPCDPRKTIPVCSGHVTCEVKNDAGKKVRVTRPVMCSGDSCSGKLNNTSATMCARDLKTESEVRSERTFMTQPEAYRIKSNQKAGEI